MAGCDRSCRPDARPADTNRGRGSPMAGRERPSASPSAPSPRMPACRSPRCRRCCATPMASARPCAPRCRRRCRRSATGRTPRRAACAARPTRSACCCPTSSNPFFADILAGVNAALERTQYQPLLGLGHASGTIEHALVDAMVDRQMDGMILIGPRMATDELKRIAERIPTVIIGCICRMRSDFDTVNNDDVLGGSLAVRHLHELGHRDIAYLSLDLPLHNVERDTFAPREKRLSRGDEGSRPFAAHPRGPRRRSTAARRAGGGAPPAAIARSVRRRSSAGPTSSRSRC